VTVERWQPGQSIGLQEYYFYGGKFIRETRPLNLCGTTATPASGQWYSIPIVLFEGDVVTNLGFASSGSSTPSQWWFALYSPAGLLIDQTAAQGATAWGASTAKLLPLSAGAYRVPASGAYGLMFYMVGTVGAMLATSAPVSAIMASIQSVIAPNMPIYPANTTTLASTATAPANTSAGSRTNATPLWGCVT
jgi:hypothetical protein